MSVYTIFYKEGTKMMRPVKNREEYLALRGSERQKAIVKRVREGDKLLKNKLVQMNYSCLPNDDGSLKGSKRPSDTVGLDLDFVAPTDLTDEEARRWMDEQMQRVPDLVMARREELGLMMLERSASKGYHLVFRRHQDLT